MRLNRVYLMFAVFVAVVFAGCKNDDPNDNSFGNKLFIETENRVSTLIVKPTTFTERKVIRASVAKPTGAKIDIVYEVDPNLVDLYNMAYYDQALMLPLDNYELVQNTAEIPAGGVTSTDVVLNFKSLNTLDRKEVYVLPVTIRSATNIELLPSARTVYYLFKAGAVINVVANMQKNYLSVKWTKPAVVQGLTTITVEALVRLNAVGHIMTIMGIEEHFLIRISDQDRGSDQLQVVAGKDNFPAANLAPSIPIGKWTQISVTMNAKTGEYVIYIDGVNKVAGKVTAMNAVNLNVEGNKGFFIGKSYDNARWFDGEMAECRIWNVIRTAGQIADSRYEVAPDSPGLVAYWKFDEGAGVMVNDRTANGNHATAASPLKWMKISLPE